MPQSGATMTRAGSICGSARRMRAATVSAVSIRWSARSMTPRMIVWSGSCFSTVVSRFDCAVSIEICRTLQRHSSGRKE